MAHVRTETTVRLPVQPDALEGPPENLLAMNGKNYERVLGVILTNAAEMIHVPAEELGRVVEHTTRFVSQKKSGTKAAPIFLGPPAISLEHAWRNDSPLFHYATIYRITSLIKQRYDEVSKKLADIDTRMFTDPSKKEAMRLTETAELQFVGHYLPALEAGLADLAEATWGEKAHDYTKVLQQIAGKTADDFRLAMTRRRGQGHRNKGYGLTREEILLAIRDGRIEEAREKLDLLFGSN